MSGFSKIWGFQLTSVSFSGFKYLNQAQLLSDVLYFSNQIDSQQWLIYYISKPLVGQFEPIKVTSANISDLYLKNGKASDPPDGSNNHRNEATSTTNGKKEIKSFNDLLNSFPLIARQMQPGLERVFKEFNQGINQRDSFIQSRKPALVRRMSGDSSRSSGNGSVHSNLSASHGKSPSIKTLNVNAEEDYLRQILETAVTSTIDLFQQVDKQQLSFLGTTTELTGPIVERHIERYVTEQLHDSTIFPMLSNSRKLDDLELESRLHQMQHVDISQVGIAIHNGRRGKQQLMKRLARSVEEFRKLGVAGSPQEMTGILLTSLRIITEGESSNSVESRGEATGERALMHEKSSQVVAMNADSLVSLLLVVVIRSQVRHLHARLTYMKNFIFIDDVQSGELGYALSTFEAVLSYLANDSVGLRLASRRNHRLWDTAKNGKLSELQAILNPEHELMDSSVVPDIISVHGLISEERAKNDAVPMVMSRENGDNLADWNSTASVDHQNSSNISTLAHVFPFQAANDIYQEEPPSRKVKRVSMDMRSLSASFEPSLKSQRSSRTSTIDSKASAIEGDTSIDTLLQTQDFEGNSVLMMAVEHQQATILRHLLTLEHFYPLNVVLEDWNCEGTTLLNAAVQLAHEEVIDVILHRVLEAREQQTIVDYLSIADIHGRTAAHYLFNAPHLIRILGNVLPWRQRDKNGQTPLLALCRSYDHPNYSNMINEALYCATQEQHDGQPLHLDLHVDSKGNTLLHVVNDPQLAVTMLQHCDSDPNVANDRRFTPLMMASKYGRVDMVRAFFGDRRVDIAAREARGMTAVELAKDDEVRNRIDDMVLVSTIPRADGRVSAVVRSFLVEDGSVRLIIKSAVRSDNGLISVTTCRRSLSDFENLAQWLSREHPASWLPSIFNFRSPFQIPSKPSRATLQDIQVQLDGFLKIMLAHSTFSSHELLWEFILFPEIQPEMMAERSQKKAEIRNENITEDYEPMEDVRDIEAFVDHARESIYAVNLATKTLARRVASLRHLSAGRYADFHQIYLL